MDFKSILLKEKETVEKEFNQKVQEVKDLEIAIAKAKVQMEHLRGAFMKIQDLEKLIISDQ